MHASWQYYKFSKVNLKLLQVETTTPFVNICTLKLALIKFFRQGSDYSDKKFQKKEETKSSSNIPPSPFI